MSTDNPRLVAYPNATLHNRLKEYQKAKSFKTLSKAVITALDDYFRQLDMSKKVEVENEIVSIKQEMVELRERFEQLSAKVAHLEQQNQDSG